MKRRASLSLALALILTAASCGGGGNTAVSTNEGAGTTELIEDEKTVYDLLPDTKYGGRDFNVLVSSEWTVDTLDQMWVEAETGDVVLDAVYKRNMLVEDRFGIKIKPRTVKYGDLAATIEREVAAGETNTDFLAHSPSKLAPLAADKLFVDIHELKYADMTQPWYVKGVNDELEVAGKQYLFLTDLGFVYTSAANVMLYNRDMANNLSIPSIQETVLNGKWTLDLFEKYMKSAAADLNGNGTAERTDRYGIAILWNEMTDTIPASLGQMITEQDSSGKPKLILKSERMNDIVERCNAMFNNSEACYLTGKTADENWKTQQEMFRDGNTLFCIMNISSITKRLRDMKDDYAAIPLPKYDEAQDRYYTGNSIDSSAIFAVPVTAPDKDFSSVIIEAMSYEGARLVLPAYVETGVKVKFSNDEESKLIYDIILDGRVIDFAALFDSTGIFRLFQRLMKANSNDFVSEYDAVAPSVIDRFDEIYEKFAE